MLGKQKCKILKEIRQRIADENDIPYVTRECTHKGKCKGTCPMCESELRYLEQQLALRQSMGKRVAVAALCAGLAMGAAGCGPSSEPEPAEPTFDARIDVTEGLVPYEPDVLEGEVAWPDEPLEGETSLAPDEGEDEWELEGDVALIPDDADENGNG